MLNTSSVRFPSRTLGTAPSLAFQTWPPVCFSGYLRNGHSCFLLSCEDAADLQRPMSSTEDVQSSAKNDTIVGQNGVHVAVVRFDSSDRIGRFGVPCLLLFQGGQRCVVNTQKQTKRNQWAKVRVLDDAMEGSNMRKAELMEILGPVGEFDAELYAFQLHFNILPARYPTIQDWALLPAVEAGEDAARKDCTHLKVFSIDNASTRDIDDALSLEFDGDKCCLGIHVADVAGRIPISSALYAWAEQRASSAYHHGPAHDGTGGGSVPMLPPALAHGALSLSEGQTRPAVTVWLEVEGGKVVKRWHERTLIVNRCATTYSLFAADEEPETARARGLLQTLAGSEEAEELVAWTMVEYNAYFGGLIADRAKAEAAGGDVAGQGLLRVQESEEKGAEYAIAQAEGKQGHAKLQLAAYAHLSSPIRRFADLHNQHVLFSPAGAAIDGAGLLRLNARCGVVKRYHNVVDAMSLGYACRGSPRVFACKVEAAVDGRSLVVYTPEKRLRVNLSDTYFTAALQDRLAVGYEGAVELCGILKSGRTQLRVRIPDVVASARAAMGGYMAEQLGREALKSASSGPPPAPFKQGGGQGKAGREAGEEIAEGVASLQVAESEGPEKKGGGSVEGEAGEAGEDVLEEESAVGGLEGDAEDFETACELASGVMGYSIDDFQQRCLRVILRREADLLAMAPTGSGKTAVALLAILQAFARGQRAVYTSPIKALSNQKFAEFKDWFRKKGVKGEVSLLTGDIKIRAPPGTKNELIICTSEILRNKLVKASGQASGRDASQMVPDGGGQLQGPDPDLERLGCVVSDEVHYINDPERGAVWEETLMHLAPHVQLVALSATLRRPEDFVSWISSARNRPGEIVIRQDRHVPLHFGGLTYTKEAVDSEFVCLFSTHGPKAGIFDQERFKSLFPSAQEIQKAAQEAKANNATAAANRASRDAEHMANALVATGGNQPKRGPATVGSKQGGGKGGGYAKEFNFSHEVNKLVKSLENLDKLPAIVFCMSRKACVNAALTVHGNPLLGAGPKRKPPKEDWEAMMEWEHEEGERSHRVRTVQAKMSAMQRQHLRRFSKELRKLEAFDELDKLLRRGIAYHHAGMLPILREYVELLFQERLVKVVFATETLAVGVNMPARTVVFTQLDKPDNQGGGHRWCRTDEFWQMAGRAGRRGMDDQGFVMYAPTLSAAGEKNRVPVHELSRMLSGALPAAESQLVIDRSFVLRHLGKGFGAEVMEQTLLADQLKRQSAAIQEQKAGSGVAPIDDSVAKDIARYCELDASIKGTENQFVRLSAKQHKEAQKEMKQIEERYAGQDFTTMRTQLEDQQRTARELEHMGSRLRQEWVEAYGWLFDMEFIEWKEGDPQPDPYAPGQLLTPRGYACAAFADGHPLILGTVVADGYLEHLSLPEIAAWLCLFLREGRSKDAQAKDAQGNAVVLPSPSDGLLETYDYTDGLAKYLEVELDRHLGLLMLDWCTNKDLSRIACWIEPALLGTFVKAVMRVVSYIEVLKEVVLGLGFYEVHNRLDNHHDALLGGLVTNESLYLAMVDQ